MLLAPSEERREVERRSKEEKRKLERRKERGEINISERERKRVCS